MRSKVLLIILDGWGLSANDHGNAPLLAKTPCLDHVYLNYPKTSLSASGLEVGLGVGEPGNSEVGHLNIGSGRVVWENLPRINQAIENNTLVENKSLKDLLAKVKKTGKSLHLIGLVSDGGIHSHTNHLIALMKIAKESGVKNIYIHFISDGRDTEPRQAEKFAQEVNEAIRLNKCGKIVSLIGRYYAMDRDKNWDRQMKAFDLFTSAVGTNYPTIEQAIQANYAKGKSDEFINPSVIDGGKPIEEGDAVFLFNHRSDRMRQLLDLFSGKEGAKVPGGLNVFTMVRYDKKDTNPVLFEAINLENTLSQVIAKSGLTQFHTAETEKYAHVTYFFKAGVEKELAGETDEVVPSKKISTYDKLPEMSAKEVTQKVLMSIDKGFDFIVVNYANGDMVGHTGVLAAAVLACEVVDANLSLTLSAASKQGYKCFITADHGNCEVMIDDLTKEPNTEHTTNPVPFVFLDFQAKPFNPSPVTIAKEDYFQYAVGTPVGILADIAPSILSTMGLARPSEMMGMDLSIAML